MPKQTFFNLPEEKRNLLCVCALNEFEVHSFDQASINRIVEAAGIAKGSFYQYFDDKKDLFLYLIQEGLQGKKRTMAMALKNAKGKGLFVTLMALFRAGLEYAKGHPQLVAIGDRFLADSTHEVYREFMASQGAETENALLGLLEEAVTTKEIREGLDLEVLAMTLSSGAGTIVKAYSGNEGNEELILDKLKIFFEMIRHGVSAV